MTSYHFRGDLGPSHGISSDWYRYIHYDNGFEELYDLNTDLGERNNLAQKHPKILAELRALTDQLEAKK